MKNRIISVNLEMNAIFKAKRTKGENPMHGEREADSEIQYMQLLLALEELRHALPC